MSRTGRSKSITMDREVMHLRDSLITKVSELIYYGFWYSPEMEALRAFTEAAQKGVTGTVRLKLYKGNTIVAGRKSDRSLYKQDFATFDKDAVYDQSDASGFIRLNALRLRIRAMQQGKRTVARKRKKNDQVGIKKGGRVMPLCLSLREAPLASPVEGRREPINWMKGPDIRAYDPKAIEERWQAVWEGRSLFHVEEEKQQGEVLSPRDVPLPLRQDPYGARPELLDRRRDRPVQEDDGPQRAPSHGLGRLRHARGERRHTAREYIRRSGRGKTSLT